LRTFVPVRDCGHSSAGPTLDECADRRAAAVNPNDADIAMSRAIDLAVLDEAEAGVEMARQANRLNPFHPDWYRSGLAVMLCVDRQYDEMWASFDAIPEIHPDTSASRAAGLLPQQ